MPRTVSMQEISFAPLSQTISPRLVLDGPAVALPGSRLSISERLKARNAYWLTVKDVGNQHSQDVAIKWITCRYEGIYVALAPLYMVYDPTDVASIEFTLAEVVNHNFLRLITEEELPVVLSHMRVEVVGRRILSQERQVEILEQEIQQMLGPFEDN